MLDEERAEKMKLMLAGFQKTRNGIVKKVATPSPSHLLGAKVKNPTNEIANLIDASVASKFTTVFEKFDELRDQLTKDLGINLPRHVQSSLGLQTEKLMPLENNRLLDMPSNIHMHGASANVNQPHVNLSNNQGGRAYASSSANAFVSRDVPPVVSTSVAQNYNNNNRSVVLNSNLQQPFYQTVAYNTPPLQPVGTGISYGPVPDSYFSRTPLQISQNQISMPEFPPQACATPAPQTNNSP